MTTTTTKLEGAAESCKEETLNSTNFKTEATDYYESKANTTLQKCVVRTTCGTWS